MTKPRLTLQTQSVLAALLQEPGAERYGRELCEMAGLPSGTVYPILARLEKVGWLTSAWEDVDPAAAGRPRRRYYKLTAVGAVDGRRAIEETARRFTLPRIGDVSS